MNNVIKLIAACTAFATAITGAVVAFTGGDSDTPEPVSTIVIIGGNNIDEYQEFVNQTDLPQYDWLKQ